MSFRPWQKKNIIPRLNLGPKISHEPAAKEEPRQVRNLGDMGVYIYVIKITCAQD